MVEINWTDQAIEDIRTIAEFIARDSERFASLQVELFFEKSEILQKNPFIGRIVPELRNKRIRELILGNYRVIYYIADRYRLDVLTVHHGNRLLKRSSIFRKK